MKLAKTLRTALALTATGAALHGSATHLIGGNLGYAYVGEISPGVYRYTVRMEFYLNCGGDSNWPDFYTLLDQDYGTPLQVGCYIEDPLNPGADKTLYTITNVFLTDTTVVEPDLPNSCTIGQGLCTEKGVFEGTLDVPLNLGGYHLYFQMCCRNLSILNVANPNGTGIGYYAFIPPPLIENSSPNWLGIPVPFLCTADTTTFLNAASDPDGDLLIFSFETPYNSVAVGGGLVPPPAPLPWTVPEVNYAPGFSVAQPFGAGGYSYINGSTGLTEYWAPLQGNYVVAVEVKEYRFGQLIGRTRRDLQLQVIACPPNNTPAVVGTPSVYYEIDAGQQLCVDFEFFDADGDSLFLTAAGDIFDPLFTVPTATINSPDSALASIGTTFCWDTDCSQGQAAPYIFSISVSDNGCPPKIVDMVVQVQVNPFLGSTSINGPLNVCAGATGSAYSTQNIPGAGYTWSVTGGNVATGQGTNAITVNWGSPGIGIVSVFATDSLGCSSPPLSISVNIANVPVADAGPDIATCPGTVLPIGGSPTGPPGSTFLWSPAATLDNASAANPMASPPIGINTYVVTVTNAGCSDTDTVLVEAVLTNIDAGPSQSICIGDTTQLQATPGYTYAWTPSTSLSDTSIHNPLAFPTTTTMYHLDAYDSTGCLVKDTVEVIVNPLPTVNAGVDTTFCPGSQVTLGGSPTGPAGSQFTWSPSTDLNDPSLPNPLASPSDTITYSVAVVDSNGCAASDQVTLFELADPTVDAGPDQTICAGDTVQLQGSGSGTLLWTPALGLSDPNIPDPLASPETTTQYTLTTTDGNECTNSDQVIVQVNVAPNANAGPDKAVCLGDSVQIGTPSPGSFTWTPAAGLSDPNIPTPLASPAITTTYFVSVSDSNACSQIDSVTVTVTAPISAGGDGSVTICSNESAWLFDHLTGAYDSTGSWLDPAFNNNDASFDLLLGDDPGNWYYVVQVANAACPPDTAVVVVAVNQLPDAGFDQTVNVCSSDSAFQLPLSLGIDDSTGTWYDPNLTVVGNMYMPGISQPGTFLYVLTGSAPCPNDTAFVTVNESIALDPGIDDAVVICGSGVPFNMTDSLGGAPDGSGSWSDPFSNAHSDVFDPAVDPDGTWTYTVAAGTSCEASATLFIAVQVPSVDAGADADVCIGGSSQLNANGTGAVVWSPGASLNDSTIVDPIATPSGTTTYTITLVDTLGCVNSDAVTITVNALPTVDAGSDATICGGGNAPIGGSPTGPAGSSFIWNNGGTLSSTNAANPSASPTSTTTYTVTVTDPNSCVNSDSVTVFVNPLPFVDAGQDTSVCSGGSVQLNALGTGSFTWFPTSGLSDPNIANPVATPTSSTSYTVTLTDSLGCAASDGMNVTVNTLPTADAGPDAYVCPGFDVQLTGNGGGTYLWSPAGEVDDASLQNPLASPTATTVFTLTVTDGNGCSATDVTTVNVSTDPQVDAGPDQTICAGETVVIGGSPTSVVPGVSFTWTPATGLDDPAASNPNATPPGTTIYYVTVTSDTCTSNDAVTITVQGLAQAAFTVRLEPTCESLRAYFTDLSTGALTHAWDFNGDGAPDSDEANPQYHFPYGQDIVVTLTITDIDGCTGSVTQTWPAGTYEDLVEITVPNVFTPNGDGQNEVFTLETEAVLGACTDMFIFNRWGQKVFESFAGDLVWGGRNFAGEECNTGTYFYVIKVKDMEFKGDVYLNR